MEIKTMLTQKRIDDRFISLLETEFFKPLLSTIVKNIYDIVDSYQNKEKSSIFTYNQLDMIDKDSAASFQDISFNMINQSCYNNFFNNTLEHFNPLDQNIINDNMIKTTIHNSLIDPSMKNQNKPHQEKTESLSSIDTIDKENILILKQGWVFLDKLKAMSEKLHNNNITLSSLFKNSRKAYSILNTKNKDYLIELASFYNIPFLSSIFKISKRSLNRWIKNGTKRKKGAGRKTQDTEMVYKLIHWFNNSDNKENIKKKDIQKKALELSNEKNFQASSSWFYKFNKKHNLILYNSRNQSCTESSFSI